MPHLTRFSYASNSTATPSTIREHLTKLIKDAKSSTNRGEMTGISIYGNNYFYHCIEASSSTIDKIYAEAIQSPLNKRFKLLKREQVEQRLFTGWDIKYSISETSIQHFFQNHYQQDKFDPYLLEDEQLDEFIQLFRQNEPYLPDIKDMNALSTSSGRMINPYYLGFVVILALVVILTVFLLNYYML